MKATIAATIYLACISFSAASITSAVLSSTQLTYFEGDQVTVTLTISSSYSGTSEGIWQVSGNVSWSNTDLPWPAASIAWGSGVQPIVMTSTAPYPTYDDGDILVGCSGQAFEQYLLIDFIVSDGTPRNFVATGLEIEVLNVAPSWVQTPQDVLMNLNDASTISLSALATDPGIHDVLSYAWDLDGDGIYDDATGTSTAIADFSAYAAGIVSAGVKVSDDDGGEVIHPFQITVIPETSTVLLSALTLGMWASLRRRD